QPLGLRDRGVHGRRGRRLAQRARERDRELHVPAGRSAPRPADFDARRRPRRRGRGRSAPRRLPSQGAQRARRAPSDAPGLRIVQSVHARARRRRSGSSRLSTRLGRAGRHVSADAAHRGRRPSSSRVMKIFLARRLAQSLLVLLGVSFIVFFLLYLSGDPAVVALLGQSMPTFWLGIMLILVFSVQFNLLPSSGRGSFEHLILPAITLGLFTTARITRLTRSGMLEVLSQDYIRTARAKGVSDSPVVWKHALKNAAIPIVTIVGIELGTLLGGSVITETIFAWPGVGRLSVQAIYNRDYPVVQAAVFLLSSTFVLVN